MTDWTTQPCQSNDQNEMSRRRGNSDGSESDWRVTMIATPAAWSDSTSGTGSLQRIGSQDLDHTLAVLDAVDFTPMVNAITPTPAPGTGRRPYDRLPIVRAFFASYVVRPRVDSIVTLRLLLLRDDALREACGFGDKIPSRTTFSRVFTAMSRHPELMDAISADAIARTKEILPDLGEEIAADATAVPSYSNPDRKPPTDPDASWAWHQRAGARNGEEWVWGYKAHVLADANHDIPLVMISSTGKDNDMRYLRPLMDRFDEQHDLDTSVVIADRGYDWAENSDFLHRRGIAPVIHIRRLPNNALFDGIYTVDGFPTCLGGKAMEYVRTDPGTGRHMYRCPAGGCERKGRIRGYTTCDDSHWEDPEENIRLFGGRIRRGSPEWKRAYRKRWSIERVFSRWKTNGRLTAHHFRDRARIHLHIQLQMLALQARILTKLSA